MAQASISLDWVNDLQFDILQNNKTLRIDANPDEAASTGFRPKALILSALAGCTAIDVIEILTKMRVAFSDFKIDVAADMSEEHPKVYTKVYLTYKIKLANSEDQDKMQKAVNLSQEKYCGVSAMVVQFAKLEINIEYL
jgi:putative redox protein